MSAFQLQSAIVPVTGAASGIGLAICRRLRAEGAVPLMLDVNAERLEAAAAGIYGGSEGVDRYCGVVDVRDSRAVDACLDVLRREHGTVTHAVAAAGVGGPADILTVTDDQWHAMMDVNLHGVMYFCRAVARQLVERGRGSIVTIASIAGLAARGDRVHYVSSKAAVINMTRSLALHLGDKGVRANAVAPGVIDTPMQDANRAGFEATRETIPLKRIGTADDIASAALFLLSDLSDYITGATLVVDGGITARYR